jgi:type I restriction enzyme S subunit
MTRWPTKPLGAVCELVNGRPFKPHEWEEAGLPIIRIQNLNDPTKPFNYTTKALPEKFKVKRGDTLLSWSGTPGTSFGCFRWDGPEGWLNQHIFNVHLGEEVLPPFFIYQVNSKLDELIAKAHGGVGLQHITKGALSSVDVTVPPLAEQERIVKRLDEADELRKLRAQADRRTADLIPALFHDMFGDPAINPKGFRKEPLANLIRVKSGYSLPAKDMSVGGTFPVYGGNGISGYHSKFMFEQRVIVIGRVGVYCGSVHLSEPKSWVTDNALYICELKDDFDEQYLDRIRK